MGFARFAYALTLPAMRGDLHWTYSTAGAMNTANALGYLLGAALTPLGVARWGERRVFLVGLWLTSLGMLAFAAASAYPLLWTLRFMIGVSGALVFITALSLAVTNRGSFSAASAALLCTVGIGAGIALSGAALPFLMASGSRESWRIAWNLLAGIALMLSALVSVPVARLTDTGADAALSWRQLRKFRPLTPALLSYFLLGVGYITYMTFIFAYLRHGSPIINTLVWVILGAATMLWPLIWKRPIERWRGGLPMAASLLLVAVGTALPLVTVTTAGIAASALLMAVSFTPVAAIAALTRRSVAQDMLSFGISLLTALFAAGQAIGPSLSGALADRYGLRSGLVESALVLLVAAVLALCQREITPTAPISSIAHSHE